MQNSYLIHDNGGRPFKVIIDGNNVTILNDETQNLIAMITAQQVFIGKSPRNPMTEFSGGHGSRFDGNSILVKVGENKYIYIGIYIYSFFTEHEITYYESPIGNHDVPYPWAVDTEGNYYLMVEKKCIHPAKLLDSNPYIVFYGKEVKSSDMQIDEIIQERIC